MHRQALKEFNVSQHYPGELGWNQWLGVSATQRPQIGTLSVVEEDVVPSPKSPTLKLLEVLSP